MVQVVLVVWVLQEWVVHLVCLVHLEGPEDLVGKEKAVCLVVQVLQELLAQGCPEDRVQLVILDLMVVMETPAGLAAMVQLEEQEQQVSVVVLVGEELLACQDLMVGLDYLVLQETAALQEDLVLDSLVLLEPLVKLVFQVLMVDQEPQDLMVQMVLLEPQALIDRKSVV